MQQKNDQAGGASSRDATSLLRPNNWLAWSIAYEPTFRGLEIKLRLTSLIRQISYLSTFDFCKTLFSMKLR